MMEGLALSGPIFLPNMNTDLSQVTERVVPQFPGIMVSIVAITQNLLPIPHKPPNHKEGRSYTISTNQPKHIYVT